VKLITIRREFVEGDKFPLYFFGDQHRLNANADKNSMTRDRDEIAKTKNAMYIHMGDGSDCIAVKDRRFDSHTVDFSIVDPPRLGELGDVAVEDRVQFESSIIKKCIGAVDGNHEFRYNTENGTNITLRALDRMRHAEAYDPEGVIVTILFTDEHGHTCNASIFAAHGVATAKYKSTLLNNLLVKLRHWNDVDIIARGHCHYVGAMDEVRVGLNGNYKKLTQKNVYAVLSGGYLKTYLEDGQCYAARADLDPIDIGMQRLTLYPSRYGLRIKAQT
jgi:predicted phosphodiesterase